MSRRNSHRSHSLTAANASVDVLLSLRGTLLLTLVLVLLIINGGAG